MSNISTWFPLVVLGPITEPAHLVEPLSIFPKFSGDDAVNKLFLAFVVLRHVGVMALATVRRSRGIPLVTFFWEVGVMSVVDGDGPTMTVR